MAALHATKQHRSPVVNAMKTRNRNLIVLALTTVAAILASVKNAATPNTPRTETVCRRATAQLKTQVALATKRPATRKNARALTTVVIILASANDALPFPLKIIRRTKTARRLAQARLVPAVAIATKRPARNTTNPLPLRLNKISIRQPTRKNTILFPIRN